MVAFSTTSAPISAPRSAGKISAPVVFAGYGITANDYKYDDYAGLDVKDKFVLMLRMYWPKEKPPSIIDGSWKIPPVKAAAASAKPGCGRESLSSVMSGSAMSALQPQERVTARRRQKAESLPSAP